MGGHGIIRWLTFVSLGVLVSTRAGEDAGPVRFEDIRGARRSHGEVWYLALGKPTGADVFTKSMDLRLEPGESHLLVRTPAFLTGRTFTVRLDIVEVTGGMLRLESPAAPGETRAALVSRDGWVSLRFGPAGKKDALPLVVRSTGAMRIRHVTLYRSFEQLFGSDGRVDLVGAAYRRFGKDEILSYPLLPAAYRDHRTGQWQTVSANNEDGIEGTRLDKSYRSLLCGPLREELGLPIPVRAPDGVVLGARIKGRFAFITRPENAAPIISHAGTPNTWSMVAIGLNGAVLDTDGNGTYTGVKNQTWHKANTWIDNYGTGFLEFIVLLPQNEISVRPAGARKFSFSYLSTNGMKICAVELPPATEAVALVHDGPGRTRILLRSGGKYHPAAHIADSASPGFLTVKAGTLRFDR